MRPSHVTAELLAIAAFASAGCVVADEPRPDAGHDDPPDVVAETDDTEPPPLDTERPDDTEPADTEPADTLAPDTDDAPPAPEPPTDWGGAMVEVAAPIWAARPFDVDPGSPTEPRPPQDTITFFGDVDSDGHVDVVVAKIPNGRDVVPWEARVLRFTGGRLVEDAALGQALTVGLDPPMAAVDLDGDGWTDLVAGGAHQGVRWGTGRGTFGPWSPLSGDLTRYGGAVALLDLDADGWLDLVLGGWGCARAGWVALRTGPRSFALRDDLLTGTATDATEILASVLEDGEPFVHVVGGCFTEHPEPRSLRPVATTADGYPVLGSYDPTPVDAWWKQYPEHAGQPVDGLQPMGAGLDDLDGDGLLDLVVSIGLPPQVVLAGTGTPDFLDRLGAAAYTRPGSGGHLEFPWGVGFPDLDQDGRPEIAWAVGDDASSFQAALGHPMRNAISWNAGGLRFVDVQDRIGVVEAGSFHALAVGDPDGDGDADLAFGGHGGPPVVYRNELDVDGHHGVTLRLTGTTSNRLGLGARVEAHVAGLPVRSTIVGALGSPGGTSHADVILGTGAADHIDLLRVRWPSGCVQEIVDLPVDGIYGIDEPPTIEVLDPDRRIPANGRSTVTIRITPRTHDGAVDPTPVVTVALEGDAAGIATPLTGSQGTWTLRLQAPRTPGSTVVRVALDGVTLPIAPRVWWTGP